MTTISYDSAVITPENLNQYDALFLDSTTGEFLDDSNNKEVSQARRQALLDFVKGGKGLAGIHAATDSYHTSGRPPSPGAPAPAPTGTWPEFNEMIGGFFKFHWTYPTLIPVKIDDPNSPLTSMFPARGYEIVDETYTFAQESFSRKRVHVLTSINYNKMSAEDKAKETNPRTDHDYALSWIRREGKGRLFYEAHGHSERVYAMRPMAQAERALIRALLAVDIPGRYRGPAGDGWWASVQARLADAQTYKDLGYLLVQLTLGFLLFGPAGRALPARRETRDRPAASSSRPTPRRARR